MPKQRHFERFPLPDNWTPEGLVCIKFRIPDDPQYLSTLVGLLDTLKWSKNFEPDSTSTGAATVSRTWEAALESAPIEIEACMAIDVRQNDEQPCTLEKTEDDGETWSAWADLELCPPLVKQTADGSFWWFNKLGGPDHTGAWEPLPTGDIPDDVPPATEAPFPPGSDEFEDGTAPCVAAANITDQLRLATAEIVGYATTAESVTLAGLAFLGVLIALTGIGLIVDLAITLLSLIGTIELITLAAQYDAIDWDQLRDIIVCLLDEQGRLTNAQRDELIAQVGDWAADNYDGNQAVMILQAVIEGVTSEGLTDAAKVPSVLVAADCAECGCNLYWDLNFLTSNEGWTITASPVTAGNIRGTYVGGEGYKGQYYAPLAKNYCTIKSPDIPEGFAVCKVEWEIKCQDYGVNFYNEINFAGDWSDPYGFPQDTTADFQVKSYTWEGHKDVRNIWLGIRQTFGTSGGWIRKAKIYLKEI